MSCWCKTAFKKVTETIVFTLDIDYEIIAIIRDDFSLIHGDMHMNISCVHI